MIQLVIFAFSFRLIVVYTVLCSHKLLKSCITVARAVEQQVRFVLESFKPNEPDLGFDVVMALSSLASRYMYQRFFDVFQEVSSELRCMKAVTIITQRTLILSRVLF